MAWRPPAAESACDTWPILWLSSDGLNVIKWNFVWHTSTRLFLYVGRGGGELNKLLVQYRYSGLPNRDRTFLGRVFKPASALVDKKTLYHNLVSDQDGMTVA